MLAIFLEFDLYDKPNLRKTFEGVLYRMSTGCPWRDLPAAFGKFQVVYKCFNRWSKQEIIQKIFKRLSADADKELLMMDSRYIRAHQYATDATACSSKNSHAIGISREGAASKIHQMVDSCGKTLEIIITEGNMNNVCAAPS